MRNLISARLAANGLLVALGLLAVFHVLMLLGALPSGIVWGGRADDGAAGLAILETVGLIVTLLFVLIVAARIGYLRVPGLRKATGIAMWVVFGYFVLNVIGNLASQAHVEKLIFTPVAIVISILAFRLAIER